MKKLLALGLAGALAMGTVAATATTVSAAPNGWNQDWKKNNWNGNKNWNGNGNWNWKHRRHNNNFLFPLILGGAIGYGLSQSYPYPYGATFDDGYSDAHARWCFAHYPRSYNPVTNTYVSKRGVEKVCYSPYGPY
jgi:hypothetical protein